MIWSGDTIFLEQTRIFEQSSGKERAQVYYNIRDDICSD